MTILERRLPLHRRSSLATGKREELRVNFKVSPSFGGIHTQKRELGCPKSEF